MKKVYVCSSGQWSDFRYTQLFANEEDAKRYKMFCEEIHSDDCENGYEELDVYENYEEITIGEHESIVFDFNFETNEIVRYNFTWYAHEKYYCWDDEISVAVKLSNKPLEHHIKIARDYYFVAKELLKDHLNEPSYIKQMIINKLNKEKQS